MINIEEIKVGNIIKCGTTKAIVTFIDGDEICILHEWGETDTLKEEHFEFWDDTGVVIEEFKKILDEIKHV